jgi:L-seryl-tRNA(Ser) seleniumtransferase
MRLPSVDQVLRNLQQSGNLPHELAVEEIRSVLAERRKAWQGGVPADERPVEEIVMARLQDLLAPSLRTVINATGVVLHTNLGRAPLPTFTPLAGYSNLEYDLQEGKRGKRDIHTARLLERLLKRPAIVVNNNAAAVYLALNELAAGHEVIISRGELIEIGDGFRIPDIMMSSGAVLREVGTTNRTSVEDYRRAINERTRLILRVHPSNFRISGFTARPEVKELTELGIPLFEDLGSGWVVDPGGQKIDEPLVTDSLAAGANLVSFSCDKLLGGPQTGILAGDAELIARLRRNPMYRALRVDKLIIQALETTLGHVLRKDWQAIPALRMIFADLDQLQQRAQEVSSGIEGIAFEIRRDESKIGGGSTPDQTLPTWVIELNAPNATAFEKRLRAGQPPVITRIERGKIILDMRTIGEEEAAALVSAVNAAV